MGWIWREKPDGTRGLAYPVYVAGAAAVVLVFVLLHRRLTPGALTAPLSSRRRGADVGAITGASALIAPVEPRARPPAAETRSYRLRTDESARHPASDIPADGAPAAFDAIAETLHPAHPRPSRSAALELSAYAPLPPAFAEDSGRDPGGASRPARPQLLGYRDPSADAAAGDAPPPPAAQRAPWLARGTLLPVYLLTTVDTGDPAAVLQFALARDVWAHGLLRLRFGTRFLGKLSGHPIRDRVALTADTVLYADGTQRAISAAAVEADERGANIRPALAAGYVPPPAWVQLAPYVSDFATGYLGLLQSRAQQNLSVGVGGLTLQSSVPDEAKAPAYQASAQAIGDFTRARLREMEDRYAAYFFVPAGTACWLELEADFAGGLSHEP